MRSWPLAGARVVEGRVGVGGGPLTPGLSHAGRQ